MIRFAATLMLTLGAIVIALPDSPPVTFDPHAHLREPWHTYAVIADEIVCPEFQRLQRVRGIDDDRLSRTLRECHQTIASKSPDILARLREISRMVAPNPRRAAREIPERIGAARVRAFIERVSPTRTIVVYLLNDARRLALLGEDEQCARRFTIVGRIARQVAAGATALHMLSSDAQLHTAFYAAQELADQNLLRAPVARAVLRIYDEHCSDRASLWPCVVGYESATTLAQVRATTRRYIPFLLSPNRPPPFDRPGQLDHRFWVAATASWLRVWIDPPHAIRHEALLRALGARSLASTYLSNIRTYQVEFEETNAKTLLRLRELASGE